jgi:hypothetical protein
VETADLRYEALNGSQPPHAVVKTRLFNSLRGFVLTPLDSGDLTPLDVNGDVTEPIAVFVIAYPANMKI